MTILQILEECISRTSETHAYLKERAITVGTTTTAEITAVLASYEEMILKLETIKNRVIVKKER